MLAGLATLAGGTMLGRGGLPGSMEAGPSRYAPKLSVQIYVWTQQFESQKKTLAEGVEEALAAMHRAGYRRAELTAEFFQRELRAKTLAALVEYQLEPATVYAGGTFYEAAAAEKAVAEILELAQGLKGAGTRALLTNPSPKPGQARKSDDELNLQARYVNQLGDKLHQRGMGLMLHHHTPELVENAREWRHLLQHTDPRLVSVCVDVHWAFRGGQEPMAFLRGAGARLSSLHLRNSTQGVWMEDFGAGDVDYGKVADYLKSINFSGYLVVELAYEKDTRITRSLEEDLRLSRFYAEKVFGLHPC
jgi:inosose dehydratase